MKKVYGIEIELVIQSNGMTSTLEEGMTVVGDGLIMNRITAPKSAKVYIHRSDGRVREMDLRRAFGDYAIYEGRILLVNTDQGALQIRAGKNFGTSTARQDITRLHPDEFREKVSNVISNTEEKSQVVEQSEAISTPKQDLSSEVLSQHEAHVQIVLACKEDLRKTRSGFWLTSRTDLGKEFNCSKFGRNNSHHVESLFRAEGLRIIPGLHNKLQHVVVTLTREGLYKENPEVFVSSDPCEIVQDALEFALGKEDIAISD